jgi:hypothetical protein
MVSKGNSNRKKDSVKESKPKEKAEPKPEVNMEEVIKQVAQKVVSELKPDMVNKINENTQQLAKQIAEEIKDIRASIQQPERPSAYAEQQPQTETEQPLGQPEMQQQQPQTTLELLLPHLLRLFSPQPPNQQMFQTFEQAQIRKNMADMSMDDYINRAVKQKMLKQILGSAWNEDEFHKAQKTADHYMKPLRDVGINAEKVEQLKHIQAEREKSNE